MNMKDMNYEGEKLITAVIMQAVEDAGYEGINKKFLKVKQDAIDWIVGKDPQYPNKDDRGINPLGNYDLQNFGYEVSIIAETIYVPADKVGISQERLITSIKDVRKR